MLKVGVIGAGRVGAVLAAKILQAGHVVVGVSGNSEASRLRAATLIPQIPLRPADQIVAEADLLILCVRDDVLPEVVNALAAKVRPGTYVCHTSGSLGRGILSPMAEKGAHTFAFHPAMTFTGTEIDLDRKFQVGATAVENDQEYVRQLASVFDSEVSFISEADRARYHAVLTHGANHLNTLVIEAISILQSIGVAEPKKILQPLLTAALDNSLELGPAALTGPVARGDIKTVSAHLAALREPIRSTYRALALATVDVASSDERIDVETAAALRSLLAGQEIE